jgi:hypothetical protein
MEDTLEDVGTDVPEDVPQSVEDEHVETDVPQQDIQNDALPEPVEDHFEHVGTGVPQSVDGNLDDVQASSDHVSTKSDGLVRFSLDETPKPRLRFWAGLTKPFRKKRHIKR